MELGHIILDKQKSESRREFLTLVESLDHLGIRQHFVVADSGTARYLERLAFTAAVDTASSPIVANCLISDVDLVHAHGYRAGLCGLIMTLTRGIPYVLDTRRDKAGDSLALRRSVKRRAVATVPEGVQSPSALLELYRQALGHGSELPKDADCG